MADPLSIASGVAGLLSFGIQVTQTLVDFYSAYKNQTPDLAKITLNLQNLLSILQSLDSARQSGQPQTDALLQEIDKAAVGCREIIEELSDECQKFQKDTALSLKDRIQVAGRRATYPFRKSTLQKLEEDIGEIRENLSLALNILQVRNQAGLEDGISELKILVERTNTMHISATIRDWLMAPDATLNHNVACEKRHSTTGLWLVNGQQFQNWLVEHNSFLWINGFAGCGKSVLCSTAIERTFRERQHQPSIGIGFFYFSFTDESKKDASGMLRALLLQLSAQLEGGEKDLQELYTLYNSGTPPVDVLLNSLRQTICKFSNTYILLDALDESPRYDKREGVLGAVKKIRQWDLSTLHLLVTSRNELDIRDALETPSYQDIPMRNPETDTDIQNFISYQLSMDPKLQRWKSRHDEIQEKLMDKAHGVFRYVECQLLALRRVRIRNELDKCLASLPRDLDETYERMLCGIDEEYIEEARLILTLLCVSNQPLTVKELVGALAIDLGKSSIDREGRSFSEDDPIDICLGLIEITVDEEIHEEPTTIARIAHFSVQEYLESDRISQQSAAKFRIQNEQAHSEMAQICLVYLLDPTLSNGELDEAKLEIFPFAHFAATYWFFFYRNSGKKKSDVEGLILRLFKDERGSFLTWVRLRNVAFGWYARIDFTLAIEDVPSPLYYAILLGFEHILSLLIASLGEEKKLNVAINKQAGFLGNALQVASSGITTDGMLDQYDYNAVNERKVQNEKAVQTLLYHGADVNIQGGHFGTALQAASCEGYEKVVQILLDQGADTNAQGGRYSNALQAAAQGGHEKVVQILLDQGADINAEGYPYSNALQAAAQGGHEKVVQILLDQGADISAEGYPHGNALQAAAQGGYEKVVQILLDQGADINARGDLFCDMFKAISQGGDLYRNALQAAAQGGHEKLVQMLLDQGAEINAQGGRCCTALQAASSGGHEKVVQILLDQGADINIQGGTYGNALQAASSGGYEELVQMLLDQGADINAQGGHFGAALHAASFEGHEKVVQMLLDHGANVNAIGGEYDNTALYGASIGGYENLVQMLLDQGADIDAQGGMRGNALQAAAHGGHEKVVQMLLDRGANINDQGGIQGNALHIALIQDHEKVVQILLDNGAEPEPELII
ncbi:hypothetical protein PCG10_007913 [Penicillium crustosum]|uniref:Uncharacterized protein n=1 Tax=Penicillium crustosum TaxID=36656 RepID=A0A9P5GIL8_PENCR|nr:uncharacterized protein N7487_010197 [Penicillium crustosum]KAF7521816.1 hypothetical protein PCG10_007913 [Penicillium crustosum]KAJ5395894.1 hypothetical protein N7487_010197 [Penicillium crustosum]